MSNLDKQEKASRKMRADNMQQAMLFEKGLKEDKKRRTISLVKNALVAAIARLEKDSKYWTRQEDKEVADLCLEDKANYESILGHVKDGNKDVAISVWRKMDTAASDILFVGGVKAEQKIVADWFGVVLNVR